MNLTITTRTHFNSAFSLVELIISIAIIAILASVSVISFSNVYIKSQLDNVAKRLLADLKLTRQQAIHDQNSYAFEINPEAHYYQALGVEDLTGSSTIYLDTSQSPYNSIDMIVSLKDPENYFIEFDSRGHVGNYGKIILTNGKHQKTITVTTGGQISATE